VGRSIEVLGLGGVTWVRRSCWKVGVWNHWMNAVEVLLRRPKDVSSDSEEAREAVLSTASVHGLSLAAIFGSIWVTRWSVPASVER
jgi:hypothetical protein